MKKNKKNNEVLDIENNKINGRQNWAVYSEGN